MKQNPDNAYRPRLSIELTQDQSTRLRKLIPWGLKNQLFSVITDDVIRLAEQHGLHSWPQFSPDQSAWKTTPPWRCLKNDNYQQHQQVTQRHVKRRTV